MKEKKLQYVEQLIQLEEVSGGLKPGGLVLHKTLLKNIGLIVELIGEHHAKVFWCIPRNEEVLSTRNDIW